MPLSPLSATKHVPGLIFMVTVYYIVSLCIIIYNFILLYSYIWLIDWVLRQDLSLWLRVAWNLLCSPDWPLTRPPVSEVLGLQAAFIVPGLLLLSLGICCCAENHDLRASWGQRIFSFLLTLPDHCSSSKEVRIGTQTRQDPGGRSWPWGHGAFYWLAQQNLLRLLSCRTQDHQPGMALLTMTGL